MVESSLFKERVKAAGRLTTTDDADGEPESRTCSFGRISPRMQQSVAFRMLDGSGRTFGYSHLYAISDDNPNLGFVVEFTRHLVVVHGRNLTKAYHYLCGHKLVELAVTDDIQSLQFGSDEGIVTKIEVREGRFEG